MSTSHSKRNLPGHTHCTANGHLSYEQAEAEAAVVFEWVSLLQAQFSFEPQMPPVWGLDEMICTGQIDGCKINLGYDNWSGCYVMAFDDTGDKWIRKIAGLLNGTTPAPTSPAVVKPSASIEPPSRPAKPLPYQPISVLTPHLTEAALAFYGLTEQLNTTNCCQLDNEWSGYCPTHLETDIQRCLKQEVLPALKLHSAELSSENIILLLQGLLACRPALTAYRARLLRDCGDYGNEFSPLAGSIRQLVELLQQKLGQRQSLLTDLPADVLDTDLALYTTADDGRIETHTRPLREYLIVL